MEFKAPIDVHLVKRNTEIKEMSLFDDAMNGFAASLVERDGKLNFTDYNVNVVTECQNNCGTEFDSPIIVLSDEQTKMAHVCWDCVDSVSPSSEDDDEENENEAADNDAGVNVGTPAENVPTA